MTFDPSGDKPVFIYCLWCPIDRRIRYIGKSINPALRIKKHVGAAQSRELSHNTARWICKVRRAGLFPRLRVLFQVPAGIPWQEAEANIIARAIAKGWRLTNQSAGGEGVTFLSEEDFQRAKKARRAGFNNEVRQRMSDGVKSVWADPDWRARMVACQSKAALKPGRREELSKAAKMRTPEGEQRRLAALKAYWENPANRQKQAERMRARFTLQKSSETV